jgi:hypothetical protein
VERCNFQDATHAKVNGKILLIRYKWGLKANGKLESPKNGGFGVDTHAGRFRMGEIEAYYKADAVGEPKEIFTAVEREIILADIAYLKQKEIESGDWAKWEESQKNWEGFERQRNALRSPYERTPGNMVNVGGRRRLSSNAVEGADGNVYYVPDYSLPQTPPMFYVQVSVGITRQEITEERFTAAVGRPPIQDDMERANCPLAGTSGHWTCGWCDDCEKPRFNGCNHPIGNRR